MQCGQAELIGLDTSQNLAAWHFADLRTECVLTEFRVSSSSFNNEGSSIAKGFPSPRIHPQKTGPICPAADPPLRDRRGLDLDPESQRRV